jgi:hypothetical protein
MSRVLAWLRMEQSACIRQIRVNPRWIRSTLLPNARLVMRWAELALVQRIDADQDLLSAHSKHATTQ